MSVKDVDSIPTELKEFYKHALLVTGILGGFSFTALILVLGSRNRFYVPLHIYSLQILPDSVYYSVLNIFLSAISIVCLIGSAAMARVVSNVSTLKMEQFAYASYGLAISSFIWALGLLLASENAIGAFLIIVFGSALWLYYISLSRQGLLVHRQDSTAHKNSSQST